MSAGTQQWEYLASDWENLNDLGNKGWELVGVVKPSLNTEPVFYLKRPLMEGKSVDH